MSRYIYRAALKQREASIMVCVLFYIVVIPLGYCLTFLTPLRLQGEFYFVFCKCLGATNFGLFIQEWIIVHCHDIMLRTFQNTLTEPDCKDFPSCSQFCHCNVIYFVTNHELQATSQGIIFIK